MSKQLKVPSLLFCESFIMDGGKKNQSMVYLWSILPVETPPLSAPVCKDVFFALFFSKLE